MHTYRYTYMQACAYNHHYGRIRVTSVPVPDSPAAGMVLVRVHAASINPADYKSAAGEQAVLLSFSWPRVVGFDFSGVVESVGDGVEDLHVGDAVFGMIAGLPQAGCGTCAELVCVHASVCALKPPAVPHIAAAAVPLVGITAVKAFKSCGLCADSGARVLVLGGAGGVGSVAIQLAKSMFGAAFVATTASAGVKADACRRLGAGLRHCRLLRRLSIALHE